MDHIAADARMCRPHPPKPCPSSPPGPLSPVRCAQNVDKNKLQEEVRQALYAAKICSYAQGMNIIKAKSEAMGWGINMGGLARIWKVRPTDAIPQVFRDVRLSAGDPARMGLQRRRPALGRAQCFRPHCTAKSIGCTCKAMHHHGGNIALRKQLKVSSAAPGADGRVPPAAAVAVARAAAPWQGSPGLAGSPPAAWGRT